MRLSVVLATYNEEENLKRCLDSVVGWCDEIIIVDGRSEDKTVEIAKKYGAKVFIEKNYPIFHVNKQKAIEKAQGKWILQLDADEATTPKLRQEIDKVIDENLFDGFWIPRKNYFLGRFLTKGGQYPDYMLRLYKNGKGRLPAKDVHEQAEVTGKVGYLKEPLLHFSDINLPRYFLRFNRYTYLLAREIKSEKSYILWKFIKFMLFKPGVWFFWTYFRHKGFFDSWQGFLFSFFSSLRFPVAFIKSLK